MPLVPENRSGMESNTESSRELPTPEEARLFFAQVRERLLQVNRWHEIAGTGTAEFLLTDTQGQPAHRAPQPGDYFRIDIPGPGTVSGEGYDWVQIEAVDEGEEEGRMTTAIRVRPAPSPINEHKDVAHFFSDEATSSFVVCQEGNKVTAGVYGRNEKPNTHTDTLVDKARNSAVAAGAISGFSKLQWKSLVNGFVKA
jgi:hypothetical protein